MAAVLSQLVSWADLELDHANLPDYPPAYNGLQLENKAGEVTRVASAVDACEASVDAALAQQADLLVVHHGLFWNKTAPLHGAYFRKLAKAMEGGLAIYSSHLPLDIHMQFGNSPLLAKKLGLEPEKMQRFLGWKGIQLGFAEDLGQEKLDDLLDRVTVAVGEEVHVCRGGGEYVGKLGIITGGAGSEVEAAKQAGIDTFLTGEGPHWSYPLAEELGVNLIYAGHYATETFAVTAFAEELSQRFSLENVGFLPHPSGL